MLTTIITAAITAAITGLVTFAIQERRLKTELRTEFMAEEQPKRYSKTKSGRSEVSKKSKSVSAASTMMSFERFSFVLALCGLKEPKGKSYGG